MSNSQKLRKTLFITLPIMILAIVVPLIVIEFFPHLTFSNAAATIVSVILSISLLYLINTFVNCQYGINYTESTYELKFKDLESLASQMKSTLVDAAFFTTYPNIKIDDKTELTAYIRPINNEQLDIVLFIVTDKLTKNGYQKLCTELLKILSTHYPKFHLFVPHIVTPIIVFRENTDIINNMLLKKIILPFQSKSHLKENKYAYTNNSYHYDNIKSYHFPVAISFALKMVRLPIFISNNPKRHLQCTRASVLNMLKVPVEEDNITLEISST